MHDGMTGTYTLDKLVVLMRVDGASLQRLLRQLGNGACCDYGVIAKDWFSSRIGMYKQNFTIELDKGISYYLGVQKWDDPPSEYNVNIKLEFNPAKVGCYPEFTAFYNQLIMIARHVDFSRFDVAIDLPVDRQYVQMRKDQRRYLHYLYSLVNRTEYLGLRSEHGNVKVYNKALEQGIDGDLTRVEITLDYDRVTWAEFQRVFPYVYFLGEATPPSKINGTDYVLFLACMDDINRLSYLDHRKRKKIEQLLEAAAQVLIPDEIQFKSILHEIRTFGKGIEPVVFEELESGEGFPEEE